MKRSKTKGKIGRWMGGVTMAGMAMGNMVLAQDALQTLEPLKVVGSEEELFKLLGSGAFVGAKEISEGGHTDIGKILAKVPGVYVRDEDGYGNFPNISLRGADGTRSEKLTVMEDGILTAPSPYSAPAAYYSPKPARMSGIEVLKGSSQVRYGPHTTGGVINYLSTEIPDEQKFYSRTTYGTDNTFFNHTWFGDTEETKVGKIGYLLEMHGQISDGFRKVDGSNQDTGFDLVEPMLKMFWEPNTALKQRIEFKVGYSDMDSSESYTGLTESDLAANPDRRYTATQFDQFTSEHWRTYAKWIAEPSDALRLESALYYNQFSREWDKLDQVNGTALHQALLNPGLVNVLNGTAPGTIRTTNNLRDHEGYGWQNQANFKFETGEITHDLAAGIRFHYDRQDANRLRSTYIADGVGNFTLGAPGALTFNGISETFATAVFVEDEIKIGKLTLRPGVRYEWLDMDFTNSSGTQFSGNENLFTAGIGSSYDLTDNSTLFSGIYQGVAAPGPESYLVTGTENEESLGFELGYRYRKDSFNAEIIGFLTDFSQLISTDAGFGFTNTSQNAGEAQVYGLESIVQYDPGVEHGLAFGLPMYVSATYTVAEFTGGNLVAGGGDGVYAGARDGNEIPYIPELKLAAGIGVSGEKWEVRLDASYMGSTWGSGFNDDANLTPSIRDGKIPALLLFDLTADYQVNDNFKLLAGVLNVFDEREIVSRIPEGPRANAPRMIFGGIEVNF
ncbi:MAG: TonB-dependent receptor family protein [Akkermansiaceae bacterium]|jgi:Fe(3+) dicitrate transport protein|nr:TonB-dependent receptor [Luteolibacter sp.]